MDSSINRLELTNIDIKAEHTILMKDHPHKEEIVILCVPFSNEVQAKVSLNFNDKSLFVNINDYTVTDKLWASMSGDQTSQLESLPSNLQEELALIHRICSETTQRVLSHIKYHLVYTVISEQLFSIKSRRWRVSGQDWKPIPSSLSIIVDVKDIPQFDEYTCKRLQESLNGEFEPLLGMRHLHRAKNESIPHYKWIDATIAAELAIKEVLIRARPELEALLLEMPSPPLTKLYGPILETYLGERSPYLKIINKGVERRNRLLHKSKMERVDGQEAVEYVNDIERVIFHLLSLLKPQNKLIQQRLKMMNL